MLNRHITVPQEFVEKVAPHLGGRSLKRWQPAHDHGRQQAELLYREDELRPAFNKLIRGSKPTQAEMAQLPPQVDWERIFLSSNEEG